MKRLRQKILLIIIAGVLLCLFVIFLLLSKQSSSITDDLQIEISNSEDMLKQTESIVIDNTFIPETLSECFLSKEDTKNIETIATEICVNSKISEDDMYIYNVHGNELVIEIVTKKSLEEMNLENINTQFDQNELLKQYINDIDKICNQGSQAQITIIIENQNINNTKTELYKRSYNKYEGIIYVNNEKYSNL